MVDATNQSAQVLKSRRTEQIPLKKLKPSPYNPARRIEARNLRVLADSMENVGLLYPLLVTTDYQIVDGHRRFAAAQKLGWPSIECIVLPKGEDPKLLYASVNATSRRMSGNDVLGVYLMDPDAVHTRFRSVYDRMEKDLGLPLMRRVYQAGGSHQLYKTALYLCNYCNYQSTGCVVKVCEWMMNHSSTGAVIHAMRSRQPAAAILRAVNKAKPLLFGLKN